MAKTIEDLIPEINALAKKSKETGLTEEEKTRQQQLRQEYIRLFRANFEKQLKTIKVVDEKGNDITPQKLKDKKSLNWSIKNCKMVFSILLFLCIMWYILRRNENGSINVIDSDN